MEPKTVVISLSPQVEKLLIDSGVDLLQELQREQIAIGRGVRPVDLPPTKQGLKSVELTILVASAAAPIVAGAISRIIDALARKRRAVIEQFESELPGPPGSTSSTSVKSKHSINISFLGLKVELSDEYGD